MIDVCRREHNKGMNRTRAPSVLLILHVARAPVIPGVMPVRISMKKLFLIALVFVVSSISAAAQSGSEPPLSVTDKAAIVQAAMKIKLERDGPTKFAEFLIFSTDNMSPALLPKIPGFRFTLMNQNQIRRNVRRRLIFRYLRIGKFSGDAEHVTFKLGINETRGGLGYHSHLYEYAFTRIK